MIHDCDDDDDDDDDGVVDDDDGEDEMTMMIDDPICMAFIDMTLRLRCIGVEEGVLPLPRDLPDAAQLF